MTIRVESQIGDLLRVELAAGVLPIDVSVAGRRASRVWVAAVLVDADELDALDFGARRALAGELRSLADTLDPDHECG